MSDVHGNAAGLARALERMGDVDELLCAGDIVEEFRFSNETVAMLREREARCVLGNHDIGFLGPHGVRARAADHVDADLVAWLASHPLTIDTIVNGKRLVLTHASPCPPHNQYVLPHSPELKRIAQIDADFVIIGHTHKQMVERVGRAAGDQPRLGRPGPRPLQRQAAVVRRARRRHRSTSSSTTTGSTTTAPCPDPSR